MKMLLAFAFVIASMLVNGAELDDLVKLLTSEDFDVRQTATEKLGNFPPEYAKTYLQMSVKEKDPEVRYRLRLAAEMVYLNKHLDKNAEWRKLNGTMPFNGARWYSQTGNTTLYGMVHEYVCKGFVVTYVDETADKILKPGDVITECDKVKPDDLPCGIAEEEYELSIRRYTDQTVVDEVITKHAPPEEGAHTEIKIKVKGVWKPEYERSAKQQFELYDRLWKAFIEDAIGEPKAEIVELPEEPAK